MSPRRASAHQFRANGCSNANLLKLRMPPTKVGVKGTHWVAEMFQDFGS